MKSLFAIIVFIVLILSWTLLLAQEQEQTDIPTPITDKLPLVVETIIGALSALIVEFIQKQKSPAVSLIMAVVISFAVGLISSFVLKIPTSDLPVFLVTVFSLSSTTWAVLFKGLGVKKFLNT